MSQSDWVYWIDISKLKTDYLLSFRILFLHMLICYFSLIDGVNQYAWPVNTVEHKYLLL